MFNLKKNIYNIYIYIYIYIYMKKFTIAIMALATMIASSKNMQNLGNKKINDNDPKFQLQLVIVNNTENVSLDNSDYITSFYLDIAINGITLTTKDFNNVDLDKVPYNYNDTFRTEQTTKTIYTLNLTPSSKHVHFNFHFGTLWQPTIFPVYAHSELCNASIDYYFYKVYNYTKNNGTQIVITANGYGGNNNANWQLEFYKF